MQVSNDFLEGKLLERLWNEFAENDGWEPEQLNMLDLLLRSCSTALDGYAMCFSADGDLLSQWRGYANDGTGVCIGFDIAYLESLSDFSNREAQKANGGHGFRLIRVAYSDEEHRIILKSWFDLLKGKVNLILDAQRERAIALHDLDRSNETTMTYSQSFHEARQVIEHFRSTMEFTHKGDAFEEEKEWRLLTNGKPYQKIEFHAANGRLVPFITVPLTERNIAIATVTLGPRCSVPMSVIELCLESSGYLGVGVGKSRASYR